MTDDQYDRRLHNVTKLKLYHRKDQTNLPKTVSPMNSHHNTAHNNK